jgi:hypothetical protein
MMKLLDRIGLIFFLAGFPTAMLIYVLSDRTCWSNTKAMLFSTFFIVSGIITAPLFGLGFAWVTFEDWNDDRLTKRLMKGA